MLAPSMYNLPTVIDKSGYTEEIVLDLGISGELVFLVVVPEIGACRVPDVALSYFMSGADEYIAEAMPAYWSTGALSGQWTIKRERLRILAESWEEFTEKCMRLANVALGDEGLSTEATGIQPPATIKPESGMAVVINKLRKNTLDAAIGAAIKNAGGSRKTADVYLALRDLALKETQPFNGQTEGDSLCYTNDNNRTVKLTKNALRKRLDRIASQ